MSDHAVGKHVGYDLNSEETMKAPVIASDPRAAAVRALIPLLLLSAAAILWAASGSSTTIERRLTFTSLSVTAVAWAGVALIVGRRTPHHSLLRLGPWMLLYGGITFGLASPTAWLAPQSLSNALSLESLLRV